nr:hypothetical protein [Tanacetum cinerariifolium]
KEIAKPITPPSEIEYKEDSDPEQAQRDKDMQKNLALIAKYFKKIYKPTNNNLRTSLNSRNKKVDTTPWYKNDNHSGQFRNQRTKAKRVKDSAYHKEKMLLCKQAKQEAHYSYMAKIQEVPTADSGIDSEPLEQAQSEIPCLYAFPYDQSTHANSLIPDGEETLALEREIRSKFNKDLVRPYDYTTLNNLYENFKPPTHEFEIQLAHVNEIRRKMWRKSFVKYKPNIFKNIGFLPVSKSDPICHQFHRLLTLLRIVQLILFIVDSGCTKHMTGNLKLLEAHYSYMAKSQDVPTADSGTDFEPLEHVQNDTAYNVFTNDLQHSKQSESFSNTCLVETNDSNVIPDSPDICDDDIQNDQNDVESDDEQTSKTLGESNSVWDSCLAALQNKQTEFEKYKAFNDRTVGYDKLE